MLPKMFLILLLFFTSYISVPQNTPSFTSKKEYKAVRVTSSPKIDGILDEEVWKDQPVATNFVMVEPGDGNTARETHPTRVKVLYDDEAIYIGAYLIDNEPQRILRQFSQRDDLGQSDLFMVDLNTYNDGENQTRFIVTSAGAIADAKMSGENEDFAYDVVWEAEISMDDNGWYAEIKIPYAALRFPKKDEQLWGLQFIRKIAHLNEIYTWNYINKSVGKITQYTGLLKGIKDIDPPVRLSFYPYTSGEVDNYRGNTQTNFSAGLDFKYGITDAFTLDATLIPDFGQTAFDRVELNLGPFEQAFNENRAFFTEGTELFTKGNLFYSRRIGDTPIGFNTVQTYKLKNEEIIKNPEETSLLNAFKISGRTDNDLGIGLFNAVTQETKAIFRDTISGETREIVTEPFANYNIVVLDQQFNRNSSFTLINKNVTREGNYRDGNVSGFLFDIFNRSNSFNFSGEAKMSNVNLQQNITGFASRFGIDRTKGKFRYGVRHSFANNTYDINDLGLNFTNNYNNFYFKTSYQIFEPTKFFNEYRIQLYGNHQRRYIPNVSIGSEFGSGFFAITRNRFAFGGNFDYSTSSKDFFEPRREGKYIIYDENVGGRGWISTDYRKKFAYDIRFGYRNWPGTERENLSLSISPRFRFNDKFFVDYSFNYDNNKDRPSFVTLRPKNIYFGMRDMISLENSLRANYNFNTSQALSLIFRNFWSAATFPEGEFHVLGKDGILRKAAFSPTEDPNANFNIWNLDLSYRWRFAPGSEAILLYRNSIFNLDNRSELAYLESLENLFQQPLRQNISLRVVYFLDYNNVRRIFRS